MNIFGMRTAPAINKWHEEISCRFSDSGKSATHFIHKWESMYEGMNQINWNLYKIGMEKNLFDKFDTKVIYC